MDLSFTAPRSDDQYARVDVIDLDAGGRVLANMCQGAGPVGLVEEWMAWARGGRYGDGRDRDNQVCACRHLRMAHGHVEGGDRPGGGACGVSDWKPGYGPGWDRTVPAEDQRDPCGCTSFTLVFPVRASYDALAGCDVWELDGVDVRVGDVLVFLSDTLRIDRIEPYRPSDNPEARELHRMLGGANAPVAHAGPHFAITLDAQGAYRVLPRVFVGAR